MDGTERDAAYFAVVPYPVLSNKQLNDKAKLLYAEVSALATEKGYCWATNAALGDRLNCGERTISRYLSQLQELGFIRTQMMGASGAKGNRQRRIYIGAYVNSSIDRNGETAKFVYTGIDRNGETLNKYENNILENTPYNPPKGERVITHAKHNPERFDKLWDFYKSSTGRYRDKAKAIQQWDKLRPDQSLIAEMGKALKAQLATDQGKRGIGFPELFRWLRDRRWEELPPEDGTDGTIPAPRYIGTRVVDGEEVDVYE